jgi:hypothetical protein
MPHFVGKSLQRVVASKMLGSDRCETTIDEPSWRRKYASPKWQLYVFWGTPRHGLRGKKGNDDVGKASDNRFGPDGGVVGHGAGHSRGCSLWVSNDYSCDDGWLGHLARRVRLRGDSCRWGDLYRGESGERASLRWVDVCRGHCPGHGHPSLEQSALHRCGCRGVGGYWGRSRVGRRPPDPTSSSGRLILAERRAVPRWPRHPRYR